MTDAVLAVRIAPMAAEAPARPARLMAGPAHAGALFSPLDRPQ